MPVTRAASCVLVVGLLATVLPAPAFAQTAGDPYFEFLMARRLESQGDQAGALAALQRAAATDPKSASIRAEIAAFQLRRNRREDAEKAANEALALDAENVDAHRVLAVVVVVLSRAVRVVKAHAEAAAVLGFSAAIAAYGGFFIPKSYGTSISMTGGPEGALYVFIFFYVTCIAMTWWYYARRNAEMPC